MTRKRFFAALFAPAAAAATAGKAEPKFSPEFRVEHQTHGIPADCQQCILTAEDLLNGEFWVVDNVTGVTRLMCRRCKDEFARAPHRLTLPTDPARGRRLGERQLSG